MMNIPDSVKSVMDLLRNEGFEAYPVGGCVRDMIMGKEPHDYDITTNALPDETEAVFKDFRLVTAGKKHGTIGVVTESGVIEITTYRVDGNYVDNRHPEGVSFTPHIKDDLSRRDFTVNAIASDGEKVIDLFGGTADIENKIIRCVGNPVRRFEEDALRIMRGLRFASVLGFEIEKETGEAMKKSANLLKNISAERIYTELCKLICGKNAEEILLGFKDVFAVVIPELKPCFGFEQKNRYHCYDVYTHMVKAVSACPGDLCTRLAALFHDIGKPECFTLDENGTGHFYGHSKVSADIAGEIMQRLKSSSEERYVVEQLVLHHDREILCNPSAVKRFLSKTDEKVYKRIFDLKRGDNSAQSPHVQGRIEDINKVEELMYEVLEQKECFSASHLAVGGKDLIKLGIQPSKEMGDILRKLLDEVIEGRVENDKEKLIEFVVKTVRKVKI